MLKYRIISATILLSIVASLFVWAPTWLVISFLLLLTALATLETVKMLESADYPVLKWTALGLGLLIVVATWLANTASEEDWLGKHLVWLVPGISAWVVFMGCLFRSDQSTSLRKVAGTFLTLGYAPGLMVFFVLLLLIQPLPLEDADARNLLLYGILVTKFTDIGAYFTGRFLGKHKLIPIISPAKTWEGVAGGVILCVLGSWLILHFEGMQICGIPFLWYDALVLPSLLGVTGILGDLVESMLKRSAEVKDSGSWIRGMGGVLDVLDSPMFSIPVLYVYAQYMVLR